MFLISILLLTVSYLFYDMNRYMKINKAGQFDAQQRAIVNMSMPSQESHVVTKKYADASYSRVLKKMEDSFKSNQQSIDSKLRKVNADLVALTRKRTALEPLEDVGNPKLLMLDTDVLLSQLNLPFCATVERGVSVSTTQKETIRFNTFTGGNTHVSLVERQIKIKSNLSFLIEILLYIPQQPPPTITINLLQGTTPLVEEKEITISDDFYAYHAVKIEGKRDQLLSLHINSSTASRLYPFVKVSTTQPTPYDFYRHYMALDRTDDTRVTNQITEWRSEWQTAMETFHNSKQSDVEATMTRYKGMLSEIENQLNDLQTGALVDLSVATAQLTSSLKSNESHWSSQLSDIAQKVISLQSQWTHLEERRKALEQTLSMFDDDLEKKISRHTETLQDMQQETLSQTSKEMAAFRTALEDQRTVWIGQINDVKKQAETENTMVTDLETKRLMLSKDLESLTSTITKRQENLETKLKDQEELMTLRKGLFDKSVTDAMATFRTDERRSDRKQKEMSKKLDDQISSHSMVLKKLDDIKADLEREIGVLKYQVGNIQTDLFNNTQNIDTLLGYHSIDITSDI